MRLPLASIWNFISSKLTNATGASSGLWFWFGGTETKLDEKSALTVGTYFQCIRNLAEDTSKLPFRLIRNVGRTREIIPDPLDYVFNVAFNPSMTAFTGRCTLMQWAAGWGYAYAEIVRNGKGQVVELWPIHPSRVELKINKDGTRTYKVHNDNGGTITLSQEQMFHMYGMSSDGYQGYSVLQLQQNTLGIAATTQRFAKHFFDNNARPGGILTTDQVLKPETREAIKKAWQEAYAGPENAGKTAVLDASLKYSSVSMPMKDVEFLELRRFQKEEIAAWFRMPLSKLQDSQRAQGWSTLDALETDYVNSCLMPWLIRFEQEVKRQLMAEMPEDVWAHVEVKGLLRGAIKERTEFYRQLFTMGAITPNEIRALEDMDAIDAPAMDRTYTQGANVPIELAGAQQQAQATAAEPVEPAEPAPMEPQNRIKKLNGNGAHHG